MKPITAYAVVWEDGTIHTTPLGYDLYTHKSRAILRAKGINSLPHIQTETKVVRVEIKEVK